VETWAEDLTRLLAALEVETAALVGHSVGCMVAEQAASALGDRVWALALCGGAPAWPEQSGPVFAERARLARAGRLDEVAEAVAATGLSERCRREDPRLLGLMRALIAGNDAEGYALSAEATARGRMTGLARVGCPALAFCGEEDPVTPPAAAAEIAASLSRGETAVVPGTAHWCTVEDPAATNRVLFEFLERSAPG
jgi:pimeloyl-ACP methyl ester carboxylesterase